MKIRTVSLCLTALSLIICLDTVNAQSVTPVRAKPTLSNPKGIAKAKTAVEASPEDIKVHEAYIKAVGIKSPSLANQYNIWMRKYPQNAVIPMAIGLAFCDVESPEAKPYLLKVVELEPKNAKAWFNLSRDADRWGQKELSIDYMKKASLADPTDPNYAFYYNESFSEIEDNVTFTKRVFTFAEKFPQSERGAQALYWLGEGNREPNYQIKVGEALKQLFSPKKFNWSEFGMWWLYDAYIQVQPEKAVALVSEMSGDEKIWEPRKVFADAIVKSDQLTAAGNVKDAIVVLNAVKTPRFSQLADYVVLKKAELNDKVGNTQAAYDTVIAKFAAVPTKYLQIAAERYGTKIGRSKEQVNDNIKAIRAKGVSRAKPFNLALYTKNENLSLEKLRGKVVLLTFWFPGCGPCRGEFPHFQAVVDKYKGKDVEYVGINVSPDQDPYVIPFMQNTKYSFIPLHGTEATTKDYGVIGEPENFLIDPKGNIVFRKFRIDASNRESLEMMINSLLAEK